jgi:predicted RNA-binding protein with PUA-like domain
MRIVSLRYTPSTPIRHWLIKSEPDVFSIDDLAKVHQEPWSGVRNYQARNFMWKEMRIGEMALFYHSNAKPPGIAGVARVASDAYPDPTQFDATSEYFDPKATTASPRWWLVDFSFVEKFSTLLTLDALKSDPVLCNLLVCQRGTRLSITPVEDLHYQRIEEMKCSA